VGGGYIFFLPPLPTQLPFNKLHNKQQREKEKKNKNQEKSRARGKTIYFTPPENGQ